MVLIEIFGVFVDVLDLGPGIVGRLTVLFISICKAGVNELFWPCEAGLNGFSANKKPFYFSYFSRIVNINIMSEKCLKPFKLSDFAVFISFSSISNVHFLKSTLKFSKPDFNVLISDLKSFVIPFWISSSCVLTLAELLFNCLASSAKTVLHLN